MRCILSLFINSLLISGKYVILHKMTAYMKVQLWFINILLHSRKENEKCLRKNPVCHAGLF